MFNIYSIFIFCMFLLLCIFWEPLIVKPFCTFHFRRNISFLRNIIYSGFKVANLSLNFVTVDLFTNGKHSYSVVDFVITIPRKISKNEFNLIYAEKEDLVYNLCS